MKLLIRNTQPYSLVSDAYTPTSGELTVPALPRLQLSDYTPAIITNQLSAKEAALFRIKVQAQELINELQWRIERANERGSIGADGESIADVLREREAVRRASNRAEEYIEALEDATEARQYHLNVMVSDYPQPRYMPHTKLQFVRLIKSAGGTTNEQVVAAYKDAQLEFFWLMFELSTSVERDDPEIAEGLDALEQLGYLPNGKQSVLDNWPVE